MMMTHDQIGEEEEKDGEDEQKEGKRSLFVLNLLYPIINECIRLGRPTGEREPLGFRQSISLRETCATLCQSWPSLHRSLLFRTGHSSIYKYSRFVRRCSPSGKVVICGQFVMYKRLSEVRSPTDSGKAHVPGQFGISSRVSDVRLSVYCSKFITS
eukprot:TRINITY_DN2743_c0_g1_i2.p1 TRINITY_DN2743_c0_g1~~TRINITY_DN2743_c0_g1_i2.p1  ORF type:complete len:156 (-),score=13.71 TRINITY_DN2743_c0_g1_i2:719-1186(-)